MQGIQIYQQAWVQQELRAWVQQEREWKQEQEH
jgi:hypothetical protein